MVSGAKMSSELEEGEFWLPAEFLDEDFFLQETQTGETKLMGLVTGKPSASPAESATETESDEEDSIAEVTREMARHFLHDEKMPFLSKAKVMATSPQSPLCNSGTWSVSSGCSLKRPSQVPASSLVQVEHGRDLLFAGSGEIIKMKKAEERVLRFGLVNSPEKLPNNRFDSNPILTQRQIQATQVEILNPFPSPVFPQNLERRFAFPAGLIFVFQFYQLKRQQLIKQQLSAAWGRQKQATMATRSSPAVGTWPQLPTAGMRAVFLNSPGTRRKSAGTGVFLPRRACSTNEPTKKPACSTVLVPARVVQALNLNLDDIGVHRLTGFHSLEHGKPPLFILSSLPRSLFLLFTELRVLNFQKWVWPIAMPVSLFRNAGISVLHQPPSPAARAACRQNGPTDSILTLCQLFDLE
ncbi:hypothetical protein AXF42_Ash008215 [Apostasia shenzhenica]|uniref:Uncharacterized protein n=1 Tax=Apostasia shenzhenica TaxID=1088818 RepID=A0A2I0A8X1_9ASPA|nr:hypothetical protein AXF42_Ash008215 [Apostasia shenzhenica]